MPSRNLEAAERLEAYTDGRTLYLPPQVARSDHARREPDRLPRDHRPRGGAVFYGTLAADGGLEPLRAAPDVALANAIFDVVERTPRRAAGGRFPRHRARPPTGLGAAALQDARRSPLPGRGQALKRSSAAHARWRGRPHRGLRSRQGEQVRRLLARRRRAASGARSNVATASI
ncbi:MAG: hypothetical protein U0841_28125 [Chloroflexia bacterium]